MTLSDNVIIAGIGAIATILVSTINVVFSVIGSNRSKRNEQHLVDNKEQLKTLVTQTDGLTKELVRVTGQSERAKGVLEGEAHGT